MNKALEALGRAELNVDDRGDEYFILEPDDFKTIREALQSMQWQPLRTIPKNEKVLLWMPNKYVLGHVCCGIADPENHEKGIYWFYDDDESAGMVPVHHATHWQPISPPAPQGDE